MSKRENKFAWRKRANELVGEVSSPLYLALITAGARPISAPFAIAALTSSPVPRAALPACSSLSSLFFFAAADATTVAAGGASRQNSSGTTPTRLADTLYPTWITRKVRVWVAVWAWSPVLACRPRGPGQSEDVDTHSGRVRNMNCMSRPRDHSVSILSTPRREGCPWYSYKDGRTPAPWDKSAMRFAQTAASWKPIESCSHRAVSHTHRQC